MVRIVSKLQVAHAPHFCVERKNFQTLVGNYDSFLFFVSLYVLRACHWRFGLLRGPIVRFVCMLSMVRLLFRLYCFIHRLEWCHEIWNTSCYYTISLNRRRRAALARLLISQHFAFAGHPNHFSKVIFLYLAHWPTNAIVVPPTLVLSPRVTVWTARPHGMSTSPSDVIVPPARQVSVFLFVLLLFLHAAMYRSARASSFSCYAQPCFSLLCPGVARTEEGCI